MKDHPRLSQRLYDPNSASSLVLLSHQGGEGAPQCRRLAPRVASAFDRSTFAERDSLLVRDLSEQTSRSPRTRSLIPLAQLCLAVTLTAGLSGCGGSRDEPEAVQTSSPVTSEPHANEPVANSPPVKPTAPEVEPAVDTASTERQEQAAAHFDTLTSTNVTPDQWTKAQEALVELGSDAVPVLTEHFASADPYVREMAVTILAMIGPRSADAEDALLTALNDDSIHVRANAATALCLIPGRETEVIPVLTDLLGHDDPQLRQMAATNLGNFGPEAAPFVAQLAAVLETGPADVVVPVAEILGRIGPDARAAAPRLQQIAFEDDGEARQAATAALQRIIPEKSE